ncbi:MAG: hypothetical protein QOD75_4094 [Blastocatellia bacterium]|jgi:hypothetical protein|nr:hypothetical protein [Blastocatellia bacterium]
MSLDLRKYRGTLAVTALVFSLYCSGFTASALQGLLDLGRLRATLPDSSALRVSVFATIELGGLFLLFVGGWVMWLVLMKPLFSKSEMSAYLGFELEPQSRLKKVFKRVFNLIY